MNNNTGKTRKKRSNSTMKKVLIVSVLVLILILSAAGTYVYMLLNMVSEGSLTTDGDTGTPINREELGIDIDAPRPKDSGIYNILVLGLDRRSSNEAARSDAMMIATVDTKGNVVKLTSLMRDMYVDIPGRDGNRINTGYVFGGPALAIRTVNENFNLNIEHYVAVDFFGFQEIIDMVGGVEIKLSAAEAKEIGKSGAGTYQLNGKQALDYSRIRSIGGDFERTQRQRVVLNGLFSQGKRTSLLKIPDLLSNAMPYIETNLSKAEMLRFGMNVLESGSRELEQFRLPVEGAYKQERIRGMAVIVPDINKNREALHTFIYSKE